MRYLFSAVCLAALAASAAHAQDEKKPIKIVFHGHSFFEIRSSKGTTVIIDPHAIETYGTPRDLEADLALLSHPHNDHTMVGVLANAKTKTKNKDKVKVIEGWKRDGARLTWNIVDEKFKDVRVRSVGTYHDTRQGLERGINTVFIVEVDGWKIAHLGDLGHELSRKQVKDIGEVDVLMIPVGGVYTLNGSEALKVVKQIEPKEYIFPMHYGTIVFNDVLGPDEFLEGFPKRQVLDAVVVRDNQITLNMDRDRPRPLVVTLHWLPKGRVQEKE